MWGHGVLPAALPAPFSATLSPALWVYLCVNMGPQGLLVVRLPAPFIPNSASLGPAMATRVLSGPVPVSAPLTGLDECLFFIYLVSDFLAVRFSVSSGCVRRRSVSTSAATLVLSNCSLFQCLWLYFACLFVLLTRFHLKVRLYGICFLTTWLISLSRIFSHPCCHKG